MWSSPYVAVLTSYPAGLKPCPAHWEFNPIGKKPVRRGRTVFLPEKLSCSLFPVLLRYLFQSFKL